MNRRRRKSNRGSGIIVFVIIAFVAVVAFMTNPNEYVHKEAMRVRAMSVVNEIVAEQNPLVQVAWNTLNGNRLLNEFVNLTVTSDNYFLFSITKVNWDNQSYTVGFGIFGNVFITRHLDRNLVQPMIEDAQNSVISTIPPFLRIIFQ